MTDRPSWTDAWKEAVDSVGREFRVWDLVAADVVDASTIRKYCEGLELSSPIHYDDETARRYGYRGIVAPLSAVTQVLVDPGIWRPGDAPLWVEDAPDAQPVQSGIGRWIRDHLPGPQTDYLVMTDVEVTAHGDVCVGDRLTMQGQTLLACTPKETSLGRGAFMTIESSCFAQTGVRVASVRRSLFRYQSFAQIEETAR
jgi:hypothetical protein